MTDDQAKHLAKLRQLYESGVLDEETYRATITALQTTTTAAKVEDSGAIAQGPAAKAAGERGVVAEEVHGSVITGDQNIIVIAAEVAESFWQQFQPRRLSHQELQQATKSYLTYLLDRYRYLDFKGMGISERVPLRLPLVEMYVPLKARIELPEGQTWARQLQLAGRTVSPEEAEAIGSRLSEPKPLLELLQQNPGLIILGDPGAGKTTFLKYLALRLAMGEGEALGLGPRLPILLPLSAYAGALDKKEIGLDQFIAVHYRDRGIDLPLGPMLREALAQGGALLLLDGLDEVKDIRQRSLVVERVIDFFSLQQQAGNKFILTSRIVGYKEVRPSSAGLVECTLVDFEDDEIKEFVTRWTGALERAARGRTQVAAQEAEQEAEELLTTLKRNPRVRYLAANPLLLTILALMKRQGVILPERRVELYQKYVETLLKTWNLARGLGRPASRDLDVVETLKVLAPLALWMHQTSPGVGLVKREALRRKLELICTERGAAQPEQTARQLLADVQEYTSLLLERGPGEYGFIHLTFQEYLAAVALASQGQRDVEPVVEALAAHIGDDNWREVNLLTVGYMGVIQQRDEAAGNLLERLIERSPGELGQAVVLAGEAILDAGPSGVTPASQARVMKALIDTMQDLPRGVNPLIRANAGNILARLGDPRPGVGLRSDGLPDIVWCEVAAGPFLMGSDQTKDPLADQRELPQHTVILPAYRMSQYPITNAQYLAFVRDGGYTEKWRQCWTGAGWGWKKGRTGPKTYRGVFDLPNHPVVGVSWFEAMAFCSWLTARLHQTGEIGRNVLIILPSEAEWEKAGRGTEGRIFPWGDDASPNLANFRRTGIGATSPVGCFPAGVSPYGCQDISGNVWEWTRTLRWHPADQIDFSFPYNPVDGREDISAGAEAPRQVRGGAFLNLEPYLRCAYRVASKSYPITGGNYNGFRAACLSASR